MNRHDMLRRPLLRSAALLTVACLGLGLVLTAGPGQTTDGARWEPYPPFIMTYVTGPAPNANTVRLTWLGQRSWQTKVVESPGDESWVGSASAYDGATYVHVYPWGIDIDYLSCGADASWVPGRWFVPRALTADQGWEALGRGRDGYDHFLEIVRDGETEFRTLVRRDPASGLVMEAMNWDAEADAYVTAFKVISLEILPESDASEGACEDVEIRHLKPPPQPQPTQLADGPE